MEAEKVNGTIGPKHMLFVGEPGVDFGPFPSKEVWDAFKPKITTPIVGVMICFGTAGGNNVNSNFEDLWQTH